MGPSVDLIFGPKPRLILAMLRPAASVARVIHAPLPMTNIHM